MCNAAPVFWPDTGIIKPLKIIVKMQDDLHSFLFHILGKQLCKFRLLSFALGSKISILTKKKKKKKVPLSKTWDIDTKVKVRQFKSIMKGNHKIDTKEEKDSIMVFDGGVVFWRKSPLFIVCSIYWCVLWQQVLKRSEHILSIS